MRVGDLIRLGTVTIKVMEIVGMEAKINRSTTEAFFVEYAGREMRLRVGRRKTNVWKKRESADFA